MDDIMFKKLKSFIDYRKKIKSLNKSIAELNLLLKTKTETIRKLREEIFKLKNEKTELVKKFEIKEKILQQKIYFLEQQLEKK